MNKEIRHVALCPEISNNTYLYIDMKNTILRNRIQTSLNYYLWKAYFYKVLYHTLSIVSIILPSLATFLTCVTSEKLGNCEKCGIAAITALAEVNLGLLAMLDVMKRKII